jgi:uncharacterized membrane protein
MRPGSVAPATGLLAWALAVDGLALWAGPSSMRTFLVAVFILLGPGLGLVGLLGIEDPWQLLTLAFGVSLALDTAVALLLVYVVGWYPGAGLGILLAIAIAGALAQLWAGFVVNAP